VFLPDTDDNDGEQDQDEHDRRNDTRDQRGKHQP